VVKSSQVTTTDHGRSVTVIFIPFFLGSSYQKRFTLGFLRRPGKIRCAELLLLQDKISGCGVAMGDGQDRGVWGVCSRPTRSRFSGLTSSSDKIQRFGFTQENDKICSSELMR